MPMGNIKSKTNCQVCIDCEPMQSPTDTCFRCYGENKYMAAPLKKDFAVNKIKPPKVAPEWCPHRKRNGQKEGARCLQTQKLGI